MDIEGLLSRVALALGIGLLIGLERGWSSREARPGSRAAGVRTFAISGLVGGLVGALAGTPGVPVSLAGAVLIGVTFATFAVVILVFTRAESMASGNRSATTAVAALLTFILGTYAVLGDVGIAVAAAVSAAGILALREGIHGLVAQITRTELESGLAILAMTFIALPIVPDRPVGPFGGVNPREVWLIAIALAAISFAAYLAVKRLGERRGVLISAAIGGLISSTAVALSNARRAAAGEGTPHILAAATALAMAVSFARVIAIVGALSLSLLSAIAPTLLVAALVAVAYSLLPFRRSAGHDASEATVQFRNPFGFWSVLAMAASMGVLIVVGNNISERFGASGTVVGAAAMGLFDVDAMTVSMTRLVPDSIERREATWAILTGVAANTFTKVAIAAAIGRGRFAVEVAAVSAACLIAGWLTLVTVFALTGTGG